jgi:NADP-dependent 3-hydroxy acid dehydrogenase YdfG
VTAIKTALVTGASRGIGLEVARVLVSGGARVAILARSERDLADRARELGDTAIPIACDVGDADAVSRAVARVRAELGAPDAIVNNAGAFTLAPVETTAPGDFRRAVDVNLVAPFLIVRAFLADMRKRGSGHIVTIGSISDRMIFPENGAYAASKFGARAFHEVLRAETRGSGVRATLVSPGPTDTPLWDEIDPDSRPGFTPRRQMLSAAAVADAVRYVLSCPPDVNISELRLSHT